MIENWYEDVEAANYRAAAGNNSADQELGERVYTCLLYTSPSPRDRQKSRMPSSA